MNNKFFSSIRGRFLLYFVVGMIVTIIAVSFFSYSTINNVFDRINYRTMSLELNQIISKTEKLIEDTERLIDTNLLINREEARMLLKIDSLSVPQLTHVINHYSNTVSALAGNYSFIDSVYIFTNDEPLLALSRNRASRIRYEMDYPTFEVRHFLIENSGDYAIKGGVDTDDFPTHRKNTEKRSLIMIARSMYIGDGKITFLMNIYESELFSYYSELVKDSSRKIHIITQDGIVISSPDKSEIGSYYNFYSNILDVSQDSYFVDKETQLRINWANTDIGLMIVSETSADEYLKDLMSIVKRVIIVFTGGMGITCILFFVWILHTLRPINKLIESMEFAGKGDYGKRLSITGNNELSLMANHYNMMLINMQKFTEDKQQKEAEIRDKELKSLRNQINPHFLYNTLNTIKCISGINGDTKVSHCISLLGSIIEPLYKIESPVWTLREELSNIKTYLDIMNIRYSNQITYVQDVPKDFEDLFIIRFILQPLIENAITHGFSDSSYKGTISLSVSIQDDLFIFVEDDGTGMSDEQIEKYNKDLNDCKDTGGIGMLNVSRRIRLRYGEEYGINLTHSNNGGLCVIVKLPVCPLQHNIK